MPRLGNSTGQSMIEIMRGHIVKGTKGGKGYAAYLDKCAIKETGFADYLESHSGGLEFTRYVNGSVSDHRSIDPNGLELALSGRDPENGKLLKGFRDGQVRFYEIPVNDSKNLDVAGVLFSDVREARELAQAAGEQAVRDYVAGRLQVRIRVADGKRRWVVPDEVMWASATHQTSRAGDPELHRHLVLVNRVRVGDKWYAIDSVKLFGMYENIRSVYETTVYNDPRLVQAMASHGLSLDANGNVPELGEAAKVFSKRRSQIEERLAELIEEWKTSTRRQYQEIRDEQGHVIGHIGHETVPDQPDDKTLLKLQLQAWADTRQAKVEWNTRVDYEAWNDELKAAGYDLRAQLAGHSIPVRRDWRTVTSEDIELCALNAVNGLQSLHSAWSLEQLEVACYEQIRALNVTGTRDDMNTLCANIGVKARALCGRLSEDPRAQVRWAKNLTTNEVIECELDIRGRLAARGVEDTAPRPDMERIAERFTLDKGQREAVSMICKTDPLAVVEGAAGAGKTHMLKAVKAYCDEHDLRLMLTTPTRKAAQVAADEVNTQAETLMKLLEAYGWRHDETDPRQPWKRLNIGDVDHRGNTYRGVPDEWRMDTHTLLVVDEAGMIDQDQMRALLHIADETGARLTLVGDRQQLNAVGRGGVLEMAEQYTGNVAVMDDVHRFKDPEYAAFTLRLREHTRETAEPLTQELLDRNMVNRYDTDERTVEAIARAWMDNPKTTVSTATNEQADMVNAAIQAKRMEAGQVGGKCCTGMVEGQMIREGDRIMTRANDRDSGVANRQTFTVARIDRQGITVRDDRYREHRLTADYVREHVQLGYASTTYGVQGVTAPDAIFYAAPGAAGADMYVALTRGKNTNRVYLTADNDQDARELLTGVIGRDKGDKGLQAARQAVQEVIDQQPEPEAKNAEQPLTDAEQHELLNLEYWAGQQLEKLGKRLADAKTSVEEAMFAQVKLEWAEKDLKQAQEQAKTAEAGWMAAKQEYEAEYEPLMERTAKEMHDSFVSLDQDLVGHGALSNYIRINRDLANCMDDLRRWDSSHFLIRLESVNGNLFPKTAERRQQLEARAEGLMRAKTAIEAKGRGFQRMWGVSWKDMRDAAERNAQEYPRYDEARMSKGLDKAVRQEAGEFVAMIPHVKELKDAYDKASRDHDLAQANLRKCETAEQEARAAVFEPKETPKQVQSRIDRITIDPDMTPRQRYEKLDGVYRKELSRRFRIWVEKDPNREWWQRLAHEKAARPDDPRWLQPVPDPNSWDFDGYYDKLSGKTLGQIIDQATAVDTSDAALETMSAFNINRAIKRVQGQNAYRTEWTDAVEDAYESYERPEVKPDHPLTVKATIQLLKERAESRIEEQREDAEERSYRQSYGGYDDGPSYDGPSLSL